VTRAKPAQPRLFEPEQPHERSEFATETVEVSVDAPIWERVFTVAPLVLVGTKEPDGTFDLAPKHMAMPLGWGNRFCFVCTPRHATYANARREGVFTVGYPHRFQVVQAALAASRREPDGTKPNLAALPTFPASVVDGVHVHGCYLHLECELERVVDGFGDAELLVGRIVAAQAREQALRAPDRDDAELLRRLAPLAYLSPGRFSSGAESFSFPFPASFSR
jgi:flavin reductase (DIM6/NTAB) family NADH-FMN oxidoreductase RutF